MRTPAVNPMSKISGRLVRILAMVLGGLLLFVCLVVGTWCFGRYWSERPRTRWKTAALERLAGMSLTNDTVRRELEDLRAPKNKNTDPGWIHGHVLLMTNGESIIYEYRHGASDYFPPHLFLGRCSDGRWLYSSYHFCNSMTMISSDDPPGSISEFARRYSAREFDGKSDACLKMTQ